MNSEKTPLKSRPKTRNAPTMELDTIDRAGAALCPKLKGFYQAISQSSILKIYVSNVEKLNDP